VIFLQEEIIAIDTEMINLAQLLKLATIVETGGQAKFLIGEGKVSVNGEKENRVRRKLYPGDIVEIDEQIIIKLTRE